MVGALATWLALTATQVAQPAPESAPVGTASTESTAGSPPATASAGAEPAGVRVGFDLRGSAGSAFQVATSNPNRWGLNAGVAVGVPLWLGQARAGGTVLVPAIGAGVEWVPNGVSRVVGEVTTTMAWAREDPRWPGMGLIEYAAGADLGARFGYENGGTGLVLGWKIGFQGRIPLGGLWVRRRAQTGVLGAWDATVASLQRNPLAFLILPLLLPFEIVGGTLNVFEVALEALYPPSGPEYRICLRAGWGT